MSEFDAAARAMESLAPSMADLSAQDINEADTRFRIIDELLTRCLGWPAEDIHNEAPAEQGFIDYLVGQPGTQYVLEAKRVGVAFTLPAGVRTGVTSIPTLIKGKVGEPLRKALRQAGAYAQSRGVPIAAAFNGHQLVVYLASRQDGVAPLEGKALVFDSPEAMLDEFLVLWNNLSPIGMKDRTLLQTLQVVSSVPPSPLSKRIVDFPGSQRRNQLQTSLQILSDLFLGGLDDLPEIKQEFIEECYATSGALSQYAEVSRQILASRYAYLESLKGGVEPAVNKHGVSPGFSADVVQAALSNRPVILLGDVGAGKSTFIERLTLVDAKEVLGASVVLYIDFGSSSTLGDLGRHVVSEVVKQLLDEHDVDIHAMPFAENVLRAELARFDSSPAGTLKTAAPEEYALARVRFVQEQLDASETYLPKALDWIHRSWRRQIVIFLDNVDQRSAEDQNAVFLIANELAARWPATVFVALRPETFYTSEREGAISGYHPRVFTIAPPRTEVMLRLRIEFALKQLMSEGRSKGFPEGIAVESENLEHFLEMLRHNLEHNRPLVSLIDNLAGGNMRVALQLTTDFIGSGHINTAKIIEKQRQSGRYTIPVHEFLRSILFGNRRYYDPESSPVPNLFRLVQAEGREHFLLSILLATVEQRGALGNEHGYITAGELYRELSGLGFSETSIANTIEYAVGFRLIDASRRYGQGASAESFRTTTVGAYCYKNLPAMFTYVDAVAVDIPILSDAERAKVQDAHSMRDRIDRVAVIADYLGSQWANAPSGGPWSWSDVEVLLRRDLARVDALN